MIQPDVIREIQDLRYLEWSRIRKSSGTAGSYLKAYSTLDGKKIYYKLSCFDSVNGITGHESVNEIIADRLLSILGIDHLQYQLIHARIIIDSREYETYICASEDFKEPGDSKIALDDYYDLEKQAGESVWMFCERMGWSEYFYHMLIIDFLILNRDRHGANIEILKNRQTGMIRPAPLFDHGLSLVYSCRTEEEVRKFDAMSDKPVQCYIGSHSTMKNLDLIPPDRRPVLRRLEERDRAVLFTGLENILSQIYQDKIWEIIWNRWKYYEEMYLGKEEI